MLEPPLESGFLPRTLVTVLSGSHYFPGVIYPFSQSPLSHSSLIPEGKRYDEDIYFRSECPKVSHVVYNFQLWVSVLATTYSKRKLF